jgi:hypothetical protein
MKQAANSTVEEKNSHTNKEWKGSYLGGFSKGMVNYKNPRSIQSLKLCFSGCIKLVSENFIKPKCKIRHTVPPVSADMVRHFYANHDISRIMPGIKDLFLLTQQARNY